MKKMNKISKTIVVYFGKLFEKGVFSVLSGDSCRHRIGPPVHMCLQCPSPPSFLRPETPITRREVIQWLEIRLRLRGLRTYKCPEM